MEFENICIVDTLDNVGFSRNHTHQMDFFGIWHENAERIGRQNTADLFHTCLFLSLAVKISLKDYLGGKLVNDLFPFFPRDIGGYHYIPGFFCT